MVKFFLTLLLFFTAQSWLKAQPEQDGSISNFTWLTIDASTKAPVYFFYIDRLDNASLISANKSNKPVKKKINGTDTVFLRYSLQNLVVPFIIMPGDSVSISFSEKLLPMVVFSKFGNKTKYNIFSDISERQTSFFSISQVGSLQNSVEELMGRYKADSAAVAKQMENISSAGYYSLCQGYLRSEYVRAMFTKERRIIDQHFFSDDKNVMYPNFRDLLVLHQYTLYSSYSQDVDIQMEQEYVAALKASGAIKNYLLYQSMRRMKAKNMNLFEKYKVDFIQKCTDAAYVKLLVTPKHDAGTSSASDFVLYKNSEPYAFEEIIKNNIGKVIIVDIWASWCGPCRAVMARSEEVHEKYADKDVAFVYLSTDTQSQAWKKAVLEEGLENSDNNFIITNPRENEVLNRFNVYAIPRYLVFDKTGKLVDKDAPLPDSKQMDRLLTKLLKQN